MLERKIAVNENSIAEKCCTDQPKMSVLRMCLQSAEIRKKREMIVRAL